MKVVTFIFIIFFSVSCSGEKKNLIDLSSIEQSSIVEIREFKAKALVGNRTAYNNLFNIYIDYGQLEDLLPFALIMSNKYGDESACMDVYHSLKELNDNMQVTNEDYRLDSLDVRTRNLAIDYLHYAYLKDISESAFILSVYYREGKYIQKNDLIADKLLYMYEKDSVNSKQFILPWIKDRNLGNVSD